MNKFDLCIIGGGPAGFAGAMRAVDMGKSVCIIEKDQIGGAGVKWGALSSKCLWELSKDYAGASRINRGYRASGLTVQVDSVLQTVSEAVKQKQYQMLSQIETFHPSKSSAGSVIFKKGSAYFETDQEVTVTLDDGTVETIQADQFLIATGSRPRQFGGIPNDHIVHDSNTILNIKEFPKRILIVGAGIIGCEYATIFSNFKQSKVFLLDHAERILPFEDPDIAGFIDQNLTNNGVIMLHKGKLRKIRHFDDHSEAIVDFAEGHSKVIDVDAVLICVGRVPNTDNLGLENLNITPDNRGKIPADNYTKISDKIYIAGDITQSMSLVNVAEMEARHAVECMYENKCEDMTYSNMSTIMFFKPEVAAVGLNEKQCREQKIPYRVAWYSNALVNRSISMRAVDGFVKIMMNTETGCILGMRAAGPQASSLVMCITMIMDSFDRVEDILRTIHPHPSMTEGVQECLRLLVGKSIYKPQVFPDYIQVRDWAPED